MYEDHYTTKLANQIITNLLLPSSDVTSVYCPLTSYNLFVGYNIKKCLVINPRATGKYYAAHGYLYIKCKGTEENNYYIAVHDGDDESLIGMSVQSSVIRVILSGD